MKFHIITLFPEMIINAFREGVVGNALRKKLFEIHLYNPRDFSTDAHRSVDDRPFGGGEGMVMLPEVLSKTLQAIPQTKKAKVIYLSPQGKKFDDQMAQKFVGEEELILISARYGGIDQRFITQFVDEEVSIGDYVLSGGELAACVVVDATLRKQPGVLGDQASAEQDSFAQGLLEEPLFTRPQEWNQLKVPEVLLSGHHQKIGHWRQHIAVLTTLKKRPDLLIDKPRKHIEKALEFYQTLSDAEKDSLGLKDLKYESF